jgi:hypothetical protein
VAEVRTTLPQAKEWRGLPKVEKAREDPLLEASEGARCVGTLIVEFYPPEM